MSLQFTIMVNDEYQVAGFLVEIDILAATQHYMYYCKSERVCCPGLSGVRPNGVPVPQSPRLF